MVYVHMLRYVLLCMSSSGWQHKHIYGDESTFIFLFVNSFQIIGFVFFFLIMYSICYTFIEQLGLQESHEATFLQIKNVL